MRVVPLLKQVIPDLRLDWVCDEAYRPLLDSCPAIDRIIDFPRSRWSRQWPMAEMLAWARHLGAAHYDVVLDLQGLARSALITLATGAPRRIGLRSAREGARWACHEIVEDSAKHAIDRYRQACEFVARCPLPEGYYSLPRPSPTEDYLILHPYTLWDTKLWPWPYIQDLVDQLDKIEIRLVGNGPWFPVRGDHVKDLRNRTPLPTLLRHLAGARTVISTDSGPAHVAAAFGIPVVALFGASDPARTAPRGERIIVLASGVPCQPCLQRRCRAPRTMECMWTLTPEQVVQAVRDLQSSLPA
ncbi:MAG: lipopolysaccharide heptosyltransferase I [Candidatus Methylacidiphilales bacterium]